MKRFCELTPGNGLVVEYAVLEGVAIDAAIDRRARVHFECGADALTMTAEPLG